MFDVSMKMIITPFTIESYEGVLALWQQTEGIGLDNVCDSKEGIQTYLERNPGMSFVAIANGKVIGAILGGHDGRRGYIHHLAVHPNCRRQGIGLKLVQNCLDIFRAAGIRKCHIFIFNDNYEGIEFWKSIGWTPREDISIISKIIEQAGEGDG